MKLTEWEWETIEDALWDYLPRIEQFEELDDVIQAILRDLHHRRPTD